MAKKKEFEENNLDNFLDALIDILAEGEVIRARRLKVQTEDLKEEHSTL